jgi:hypothetical protein
MVSQHRKHRGYRTQRVVSDYMRQWFPFADSAGAGRTGSDVLNVPFDVEVKARAGFNPKAVLDQLKAVNQANWASQCLDLMDKARHPENYCCIIRMDDLMGILIQAGYTKNLTLEPTRCNQCGSWIDKDTECSTCASL